MNWLVDAYFLSHHTILISLVRNFYLHSQMLYLNPKRLHKLRFLYQSWINRALSTNSDKAKVVEWFCQKPNWELFRTLILEKKTVQAIMDYFFKYLFKLDRSGMGL